MDLVLLIGIPATGKTTFCQLELAQTHLRISRDVVGTKHREWSLFETCLRTTTRVVIDNTNVTRAERQRFIAPARQAGFRIRGFYFQSVLADAQERNATRPAPSRLSPAALGGRSHDLELPTLSEGFDELWYVRLDDATFEIEEWQE